MTPFMERLAEVGARMIAESRDEVLQEKMAWNLREDHEHGIRLLAEYAQQFSLHHEVVAIQNEARAETDHLVALERTARENRDEYEEAKIDWDGVDAILKERRIFGTR